MSDAISEKPSFSDVRLQKAKAQKAKKRKNCKNCQKSLKAIEELDQEVWFIPYSMLNIYKLYIFIYNYIYILYIEWNFIIVFQIQITAELLKESETQVETKDAAVQTGS